MAITYNQTSKLLRIIHSEKEEATYYTFTTKSTNNQHYHYIVERKDYFEQTLWSGNIRKFYKDVKKVEFVDTVTNEVIDDTNKISYEIITND